MLKIHADAEARRALLTDLIDQVNAWAATQVPGLSTEYHRVEMIRDALVQAHGPHVEISVRPGKFGPMMIFTPRPEALEEARRERLEARKSARS
jgi:hypothetical protein